MSDFFEITLIEQIACVEREVEMRKKVYPRRVAAGAMSSEEAEDQISLMQAVLETLKERYAETKSRASLPSDWRCRFCKLSKDELEFLE